MGPEWDTHLPGRTSGHFLRGTHTFPAVLPGGTHTSAHLAGHTPSRPTSLVGHTLRGTHTSPATPGIVPEPSPGPIDARNGTHTRRAPRSGGRSFGSRPVSLRSASQDIRAASRDTHSASRGTASRDTHPSRDTHVAGRPHGPADHPPRSAGPSGPCPFAFPPPPSGLNSPPRPAARRSGPRPPGPRRRHRPARASCPSRSPVPPGSRAARPGSRGSPRGRPRASGARRSP